MDLGIPSPPKRKVSLTPLIDVVFILLLFFMLASSFIEWREIDLNVASNKSSVLQDNPPLVVRVTHDGLTLKGKQLSSQAFIEKISVLLQNNSELIVVLRPQTTIPLQQIVTLLDLIREQGVKNVSFARDNEDAA